MQYEPLDVSRRQIRLLHLQPGKPEGLLSCQFSITSLHDLDEDFEALSYVWGAYTGQHYAFIGGTPIAIIDNLWEALRSLRFTDEERILWVDAVCIDQSDNNERSHQVSHMHCIYTQAAAVIIWLGGAFEGVELASKFFCDFAKRRGPDESCASYASLDLFSESFDEDTLASDALEALRTLCAVRAIMKRPWWERTWTIQEFFLAQRSVFHCGAHTFDGAALLQCAWHLGAHSPGCCTTSLPLEWQMTLNMLFTPIKPIQRLNTVRMSLLECVGWFRSRKATDPRDKIYGMLGLGADGATEIVRPHYELPVERVYEDFTLSLLRRTKNLDVLNHLRPEHRSTFALPSYVVDWTMESCSSTHVDQEKRNSRTLHLHLYDACFGIDVVFIAHPGVLCVRGKIVDTVERMATKNLSDPRRSLEFSNGAINEWLSVARIPQRTEDTQAAVRRAFWITMCAGLGFFHRLMLPVKLNESGAHHTPPEGVFRLRDDLDIAEYDAFEQGLRNTTYDDWQNIVRLDNCSISHALMAARAFRRVAITKADRMSLVPINTTRGDVVAVLTGGRVPFILKPHDGHYTVVGDAYVHGIMDGEAMRDSEELMSIELH